MAANPGLAWHLCAQQLVEEGADVLTAGFPCQDISFAGEGAGLAGSRSGLVWPLLRTIRMVRPRFALLENVAALLGRGLDQVLGHMASFGYDAEWHCIPASAVGAPHRRDRIWIIATDAGGEQHEGGRPPISGEIAAELSRAAAYASPVFGPSFVGDEPHGDFAGVGAMADANGEGFSASWAQSLGTEWRDTRGALTAGGWWAAEPNVGRVADGVPARVDRLRTLGNAVVRFIPEIIGRTLMASSD